jgi:hypothetical protein
MIMNNEQFKQCLIKHTNKSQNQTESQNNKEDEIAKPIYLVNNEEPNKIEEYIIKTDDITDITDNTDNTDNKTIQPIVVELNGERNDDESKGEEEGESEYDEEEEDEEDEEDDTEGDDNNNETIKYKTDINVYSKYGLEEINDLEINTINNNSIDKSKSNEITQLFSNQTLEQKNPPLQSQNKSSLDELKKDYLELVDLKLEGLNDSIELKKPNEVYYEIYKIAREKAKRAKKAAIESYLEAKNIKIKYMLDDLDESDEDEHYSKHY